MITKGKFLSPYTVKMVRKVYPEVPPRVEYRLTERGYSLMPYLEGLIEWAFVHMQEIVLEGEQRL